MGLGLPGSSDSPSALSGWRAGLSGQHIATACAPGSFRCPQGMWPGETGTAVLTGPTAESPTGAGGSDYKTSHILVSLVSNLEVPRYLFHKIKDNSTNGCH